MTPRGNQAKRRRWPVLAREGQAHITASQQERVSRTVGDIGIPRRALATIALERQDRHTSAYEDHRSYVLESDTVEGPYSFAGRLQLPGDRWAIDATVLDGSGLSPISP